MTGLRQDLEKAASKANQECAPDLNAYVARRLAEWSTGAVLPLIEAALEAARADERERIEAWFDDRFPTGLYGDEVIISRAEFKAAVKDEK